MKVQTMKYQGKREIYIYIYKKKKKNKKQLSNDKKL